ncbi:MAG: methyltransferase type 12 [Sphingomonas sp.]|jgi:SAM-dependent methyltransferase|nr:methyltransferase type 12 [Sphingomonas sp.]
MTDAGSLAPAPMAPPHRWFGGSLAQRAQAEELMDADDLDPAIYAAVVRDLAKVNVVTLAARPTLRFLARAAKPGRTYRLLDVGFGDGDMLRRIARWGQRRDITFDLTGVDLNPRSEVAARAHTPAHLPIRWITGDYADLAGERWDFVISSLVAHHMTHDQLVAFLRFMEREAQGGWIVNDLHRHPVSHLGYPVLARLFGWHPIVRHDGALSIARSYRPAEWPPILAEAGVFGADVTRHFPFRLCVERRR